MKLTNLLILAFLIKSTLLFSQGIYFKVSSNYNFSTTSQQMPEYFTYQINVPSGTGMSNLYVNLNVNEFTVASGFNFQGAAGYSFNDFLSLELKFSTFGFSNKEFEAAPISLYTPNGKTTWDFQNYSLLPTILFGQTFNKSTVNIFAYSGFGIGKLNIRASLNQDFREYDFDKSHTFSWGYGLEYGYNISKNFSLFTNIGINNTQYKPRRAELISSYYSMDYLPINQKEIQYVDEITNLQVGNGLQDPNRPETRLKEKLKLNSAFLGIGIKYTLKK